MLLRFSLSPPHSLCDKSHQLFICFSYHVFANPQENAKSFVQTTKIEFYSCFSTKRKWMNTHNQINHNGSLLWANCLRIQICRQFYRRMLKAENEMAHKPFISPLVFSVSKTTRSKNINNIEIIWNPIFRKLYKTHVNVQIAHIIGLWDVNKMCVSVAYKNRLCQIWFLCRNQYFTFGNITWESASYPLDFELIYEKRKIFSLVVRIFIDDRSYYVS